MSPEFLAKVAEACERHKKENKLAGELADLFAAERDRTLLGAEFRHDEFRLTSRPIPGLSDAGGSFDDLCYPCLAVEEAERTARGRALGRLARERLGGLPHVGVVFPRRSRSNRPVTAKEVLALTKSALDAQSSGLLPEPVDATSLA